ncbi:hypothetical protein TNCV_1874541 [Trichonephila clavipes]|nr:hypothetical protein TNCV_1874541 [Trichonephila clavipes]
MTGNRLENMVYRNLWLGVLSGDWNLGKHCRGCCWGGNGGNTCLFTIRPEESGSLNIVIGCKVMESSAVYGRVRIHLEGDASIALAHSGDTLSSLTVQDMETALLEEWNSIPQSLTDNMIVSMLNSCPTPVIKNVDKITEIIQFARHVSSRSITQELKIDHKTVLSHLSKVGSKKKLDVWVPHQLTPKKHDRSNFHLRSSGQTE